MIKEFIEKLDTKAGLLHFVRNDNAHTCHPEQTCHPELVSGSCDLANGNKDKMLKLVQHDSLCKKIAFTLAEVLITLAVVGVVAAITIPNLHNTYQKAVFKAQLKKTDAYVHQLYQEWYNEGVLAYNNNSLLAGHGGLTLMTNANKCADNTKYRSMGGTYRTGTDFLGTVFCLKDGRPLMIYRTGNRFYVFVDINGYNKGPNYMGVDVFPWEITSKGVLPEGAPGTYECRRAADCLCHRRCTYDRTCGMGCTYKALHDPNYFDDWKWNRYPRL